MKIYKLDIDTSKPIRKVIQMQQNSTGALSVDVSNDGKYIRNLSCALYDGGTELSAYTTTDVGAGFKIDMGDETKVVKFTAKSVPTESVAQKILSASGPVRSKALSAIQLEAGIYNQDEFYNIANVFGSSNGLPVYLTPHASQEDNINIKRIDVRKWDINKPVWFMDKNDKILPSDEPIVVTGPVSILRTVSTKNNATLSSYTYPAVGYWTDYSLDTVIRPSDNAHCYAEQEVVDPTPDPDPEPTPDPEEPVEP